MIRRDKPEEKPLSRRARFGFMNGQAKVPDDFDTMCRAEIEEMFYGSPIAQPGEKEMPTSGERPRKP